MATQYKHSTVLLSPWLCGTVGPSSVQCDITAVSCDIIQEVTHSDCPFVLCFPGFHDRNMALNKEEQSHTLRGCSIASGQLKTIGTQSADRRPQDLWERNKVYLWMWGVCDHLVPTNTHFSPLQGTQILLRMLQWAMTEVRAWITTGPAWHLMSDHVRNDGKAAGSLHKDHRHGGGGQGDRFICSEIKSNALWWTGWGDWRKGTIQPCLRLLGNANDARFHQIC